MARCSACGKRVPTRALTVSEYDDEKAGTLRFFKVDVAVAHGVGLFNSALCAGTDKGVKQ